MQTEAKKEGGYVFKVVSSTSITIEPPTPFANAIQVLINASNFGSADLSSIVLDSLSSKNCFLRIIAPTLS